jgi:hypothetical protein
MVEDGGAELRHPSSLLLLIPHSHYSAFALKEWFRREARFRLQHFA